MLESEDFLLDRRFAMEEEDGSRSRSRSQECNRVIDYTKYHTAQESGESDGSEALTCRSGSQYTRRVAFRSRSPSLQYHSIRTKYTNNITFIVVIKVHDSEKCQ